MSKAAARPGARVIGEGRFLTLLDLGGWEYVTRASSRCSGTSISEA